MKPQTKIMLDARSAISGHKAMLARSERAENGELDSDRFRKLADQNTGDEKLFFEQASDSAKQLEMAAVSASERIELEELRSFARDEFAKGEKLLAERQAAIAEQAETLKTLSADYHAAKSGGVPTGGGGGILNAYNGIRDPEARAKFYAEHKAEIRAAIRR